MTCTKFIWGSLKYVSDFYEIIRVANLSQNFCSCLPNINIPLVLQRRKFAIQEEIINATGNA
jgi:hypothetical protein